MATAGHKNKYYIVDNDYALKWTSPRFEALFEIANIPEGNPKEFTRTEKPSR